MNCYRQVIQFFGLHNQQQGRLGNFYALLTILALSEEAGLNRNDTTNPYALTLQRLGDEYGIDENHSVARDLAFFFGARVQL